MNDRTFTDITGTICTAGDPVHCKGNGYHHNPDGTLIECCCEQCSAFQDCWPNTTDNEPYTTHYTLQDETEGE